MRNFKRYQDSVLADDNLVLLDNVMTVDDCAKACVSSTEISCQALAANCCPTKNGTSTLESFTLCMTGLPSLGGSTA